MRGRKHAWAGRRRALAAVARAGVVLGACVRVRVCVSECGVYTRGRGRGGGEGTSEHHLCVDEHWLLARERGDDSQHLATVPQAVSAALPPPL